MKSNRQRRAEITGRRARKKTAAEIAKIAERRMRLLAAHVHVNTANLRPTNSFGTPVFVDRGYYENKPFQCKDCGKQEVWSATQQKWWYEVAQGDVWTTAIRCRACRKKESARRAEARKVHLEGIAQKAGLQAGRAPNVRGKKAR